MSTHSTLLFVTLRLFSPCLQNTSWYFFSPSATNCERLQLSYTRMWFFTVQNPPQELFEVPQINKVHSSLHGHPPALSRWWKCTYHPGKSPPVWMPHCTLVLLPALCTRSSTHALSAHLFRVILVFAPPAVDHFLLDTEFHTVRWQGAKLSSSCCDPVLKLWVLMLTCLP